MSKIAEQMAHWKQLIQEAVDGTTELRQSVDRIQKQYAQEALRFDLPDDYPQQKVISDLMMVLTDNMTNSQQLVKDPRALTLLKTLTNQRLDQKAGQLDQFARLPNPKTGS